MRAVSEQESDTWARAEIPEWEQALAHVPAPVFVLSVGGSATAPEVRVVSANVAGRALMCEVPRGPLGLTLEELFPWALGHRVPGRVARVFHSQLPESFDVELGVGGARRLVVSVFPLPGGHVGVGVQDNAPYRETERRRDELLTQLAHEVRNPLAAIRGAVGLLEGGVLGDLPEGAGRLVAVAREGAERLGRLVTDLFDLERIRAGLLPLGSDTLSLTTVVELGVEAVASAARAAAVRVRVVGAAEIYIQGDRERLAQALTNVLSHAVKASPSGSDVTVTLSRPAPDRVRVAVRDGRALPEGTARIAPTVVNEESRSAGGAGSLGLVISRLVVEAHGGAIDTRMADGAEAEVWIELPVLLRHR